MSGRWSRSYVEVVAAAAGLLAGHQLTFSLITADAHAAARLWVATGHAAISPAHVLFAFAFAVAVHGIWPRSRFLVAPGGVTCQASMQVLAFVSLEAIERATVGAALWERPWLLTCGVAAQIVVAAGIVAVREGVGLLVAVGRQLGPTWGAAERSLGHSVGEVVLMSARWLVPTRPTRGPPASMTPMQLCEGGPSMRILFTLSLIALLLLLPTTALGHVTVQPTEATPGSFARFVVRAPNERPDADTTKIEVQFPPNLIFVSFQPKDGWERTTTMATLDEPIEAFGQEITEVIDTVTWEGGQVQPGEFEEFGFTARVPGDVDTLEFPAIQTYSSGEVVQWTGPEDADTPAARVSLVALPGEGEQGQLATLAEVAEAQQAGGVDLGVVALIVALAALAVAGFAAWLASRRSREHVPPREPVAAGTPEHRA